jgi:ComF family protein
MFPGKSIYRRLTHWGNACRDLLFPPQCAWCRSGISSTDGTEIDGVLLCDECVSQFVPKAWQSCPKCGGYVPLSPGTSAGCPLCRTVPFHFDSAIALGGYRPGLRSAILQMKKPRGELLALSLGRLMFRQNADRLRAFLPEAVVPVPMFWLRRFGRGVNSPQWIAVSVGKALGIPLYRKTLVRVRNTKPQSGLRPKQRFENVRGAFRVRRMKNLKGRRILLIDDVLTTGATCSEAARMLKEAGVAQVTVAVVARAQGELVDLV